MSTSPDTVIRLVLTTPSPEAVTPRVIGVDDWAWRKGHTYGTILVDLERHRVIDILPDRTADALVGWLSQHAGIEVIARDRGGAYADGARRGAPGAIQVADRWHLLANLTDTLKRTIDRRWHVLKGHLLEAVADVASERTTPPAPMPVRMESITAVERGVTASRERRLSRFEDVRRLHHEGMGIRELARTLRIGRRTVRNFLRADVFPERSPRAKGPGLLTPHIPYLHERWDAGCHNGMQLWREIRARGYTGSRSYVSYWAAKERKQQPLAPHAGHGTGVRRAKAPTPRQVVWNLARPAVELEAEERRAVARWCAACPQIATAYALAQSLGRLLRGQEDGELTAWVESAEASGVVEMIGLARGMRRDMGAVEAALTSEWSSGQVEGQNHRLKLLKRQMYGRAGFELLRQRVLNSA